MKDFAKNANAFLTSFEFATTIDSSSFTNIVKVEKFSIEKTIVNFR